MRHLIHAAHGRVGWLTECMRRLENPTYWSGGRLHVRALCIDAEIAIREGGCGPRRRSMRVDRCLAHTMSKTVGEMPTEKRAKIALNFERHG